MRRVISLFGVLVLVAGCAGGTSQGSTAPTNPPAVTTAPTVAPTPVPTTKPSPTAVSARLTFDGTTCGYTGPTVVTSPAVLNIEFAPTDEGYALNFGMILSTTTRAEVEAVDADPSYGPAPGHKTPAWLLPDTWAAIMGSMTLPYEASVRQVGDKTYDQVLITCVRNPWASDKPADTIEGRVTGPIIKLVLP